MNRDVCKKCIEKSYESLKRFEEGWEMGFVYCPKKFRNGYDIRVPIDVEVLPFWCPFKNEQESGNAEKQGGV